MPSSPSEKKVDNGKSEIASTLRMVAWIIGILAFVSGVIIAFGTENFLPVLVAFGAGAMEMLMLHTLAAVLDYLAELTSIARNGFKYTETNR